MSGDVIVQNKPRHPEGKSLKDAWAEDVERAKVVNRLGISKTSTLVSTGKSSDGSTIDPTADLIDAPGAPTDEELVQINQFTRSPKTAEQLFVVPTLSCNDLPDRDDDRFVTNCVKGFASLEQPFSPVGKSFMLDHDYEVGKTVGRIFDAEAKRADGVQWLTNKVYIPRTEQFAPLIEKIDFGVAWAVSVGVVLGKSACSVCGSAFSSYGYWCSEGHDKGYYYDPNSEEVDSWGYPAPCPPDQAGAVKCIREFDDPRDMYELSQVFLGAQYFAALDKTPEMRGLVKAAGLGKLPIIGAGKEEASKLPLHHEPDSVTKARTSYKMETLDDGSLKWVDSDGFVWVFDPTEDTEPLTLGKSEEHKSEEDDDGEHEVSEGGGGNPVQRDGSDPEGGEDSGDDPEGEPDPSGSDGEGEGSSVDDDGDAEEESEEDDDPDSSSDDEENDDNEEKDVDKETVLAAAKAAGIPEEVLSKIEASKGNGLDALLLAQSGEIKTLTEKVQELEPKAAIGDGYLADLRTEAKSAYVKAHADPSKTDKGVSLTSFEKIVDRCGDDPELLKVLIEENTKTANERFGAPVRRSSFPTDPHHLPGEKGLGEDDIPEESDKRVSRLHS